MGLTRRYKTAVFYIYSQHYQRSQIIEDTINLIIKPSCLPEESISKHAN